MAQDFMVLRVDRWRELMQAAKDTNKYFIYSIIKVRIKGMPDTAECSIGFYERRDWNDLVELIKNTPRKKVPLPVVIRLNILQAITAMRVASSHQHYEFAAALRGATRDIFDPHKVVTVPVPYRCGHIILEALDNISEQGDVLCSK